MSRRTAVLVVLALSLLAIGIKIVLSYVNRPQVSIGDIGDHVMIPRALTFCAGELYYISEEHELREDDTAPLRIGEASYVMRHREGDTPVAIAQIEDITTNMVCDGRNLYFISGIDRGQLIKLRPDGGFSAIKEVPAYAQTINLSPQKDQVAMYAGGGIILVTGLDSNSPVTDVTTRYDLDVRSAAAWSPDGSSVTFVNNYTQYEFGIHILNLETGEQQVATRSGEEPQWLPSGEIAFMDHFSLYLYDPESETTRVVYEDERLRMLWYDHDWFRDFVVFSIVEQKSCGEHCVSFKSSALWISDKEANLTPLNIERGGRAIFNEDGTQIAYLDVRNDPSVVHVVNVNLP